MKMKNALVIGFTDRTSYSMSKVLLEKGYKLIVSDIVRNEEKVALLNKLPFQDQVIDCLGEQSTSMLSRYNVDLVLPSPGVPQYIPLIKEANAKGIEVIGDVELFYRYFPDNQYLAITGTDGKTTTTSWLYEIISTEKDAVVGGNIGTPIFDHFNSIKPDTKVVLELSSFQLETIDRFSPSGGAILNVAMDHQDRYAGMEDYIEAKKNILRKQSENDIAVLNLDSSYFGILCEGIKSKIMTFSLSNHDATVYYDGKYIRVGGEEYLDASDIQLKGIHNIENAMAAILLAKVAGVSDEGIKTGLKKFRGLPHRLEYVRELNGVSIYNDSKSTTVNAIEKALMSFNEPIVLIAGGRDKGLDFSVISDLVKQKVKRLVLVGEASEKIDSQIRFDNTYLAKSFEEGVESALKSGVAGDVVILSPGCASFDMFKNYAERGDAFRSIVEKL